jgi:hypothetical protein
VAKRLKIFIIHSLSLLDVALDYEKTIRERFDVESIYVPGRDTPQHLSGWEILRRNYRALMDCDVAYVIWDGRSMGAMFDMGSAYALVRQIYPGGFSK